MNAMELLQSFRTEVWPRISGRCRRSGATSPEPLPEYSALGKRNL